MVEKLDRVESVNVGSFEVQLTTRQGSEQLNSPGVRSWGDEEQITFDQMGLREEILSAVSQLGCGTNTNSTPVDTTLDRR